ncbi:MAG: hypothetical protein CL946_04145 [Ectothiorhodospiraceae bacterium]|nr:hypothetical protein [Ectothiorhodospiraceae bacterium]
MGENVITCPECGYPNDSKLTECENCGANLLIEEQPEADEPIQDEPKSQAPASGKSAQRRTPSGKQKQQPKSEGGKSSTYVRVEGGFITSRIHFWQGVLILLIPVLLTIWMTVAIVDTAPPPPAAAQQIAAPAEGSMPDIEALKQHVNNHPHDTVSVLRLSHALHDANRFREAIPYYKLYLTMVPENPDAIVDLGVCFYSLRQYDSAIVHMERAVSLVPNHQLGNFNLGVVNYSKGSVDEATKWFSRAIEINSGNTIAQNARSILDKIEKGEPIQ